jgi:glycosyltransferase involved in cell wall biosynthesis
VILSVVVPGYNVEGYIGRCLRGLRDQDMGAQEYEIIVIDDGSTDDTLRIAREHAADDARVRVHSQSNGGLSAARNAGLDRATGTYVYFVDGDDEVEGHSLHPVVAAMREHSLDVAYVGWRRVEPDEEVRDPPHRNEAPNVTRVVNGMEYVATYLDYPTSAWSAIIDRSLLARTGARFEVGRLFEDQLFSVQVLAFAARAATVQQQVYRYTVRPGSLTRDPDPEHVKRLCSDMEHVVLGLEELRSRILAVGPAPQPFLDRLSVMQEGYVFLLIGRLIRSRVSLYPVLPHTLARLRASGFYPMERFPGTDRNHRGSRYRVLTTVFNHRWLLYPFAYVYRVASALRYRLSGWRADRTP